MTAPEGSTVKRTKVFTAGSQDYWFRFEGVNTADANAPIVAEFYKCQISPLRGLPLINNERAELEVEFAVLADVTKAVSSDFGQLGRVIQL